MAHPRSLTFRRIRTFSYCYLLPPSHIQLNFAVDKILGRCIFGILTLPPDKKGTLDAQVHIFLSQSVWKKKKKSPQKFTVTATTLHNVTSNRLKEPFGLDWTCNATVTGTRTHIWPWLKCTYSPTLYATPMAECGGKALVVLRCTGEVTSGLEAQCCSSMSTLTLGHRPILYPGINCWDKPLRP